MALYGINIILGIILSLPAPLKLGVLMLNGLLMFGFDSKQAVIHEMEGAQVQPELVAPVAEVKADAEKSVKVNFDIAQKK